MACPSDSALTGVGGRVVVNSEPVARITQWEVNPTMDTSTEWGDSSGDGYTLVAAGRKGATASTEGKFDTDTLVYNLFQPGDKVTLDLWQSAAYQWQFYCALCMNFTLNVNVDTQEVVSWTADWKADGIFYKPGQAGIGAGTYPTDF